MKRALLLVLILLLSTACSDKPDRDKVGSSGAPVDRSGEQQSSASTGSSHGQVSPVVDIIPKPLRSSDTAQATVSGCSGEIRYTWEVNGRAVPQPSSPRLLNSNFARDDEVQVLVSCNGVTSQGVATVANSPPEVNQVAFQDPYIKSGQSIEILPEAFDLEGDTVYFTVQWLIDGALLDGVQDLVLPGEYVQRGAGISVIITPSDSFDSGPAYRSLVFQVPDGAPKFVSSPETSFTALEYSYTAEAVDPDGDTITYSLGEGPQGMTVDPDTGQVVWKIDSSTIGDFSVRIVATDPGGSYAEQVFSLKLALQE